MGMDHVLLNSGFQATKEHVGEGRGIRLEKIQGKMTRGLQYHKEVDALTQRACA